MSQSTFLADLWQRHWVALSESKPLWLVSTFVALALCLPYTQRWLFKIRRPVNWLLVSAACVLGVVWAWSLLWASDDAYISFRYAENLVEGHGLVFNPGERVEGYTNFLWTIIAAVAIFLRADPGQVSILINLASFVASILLVERLSRRLRNTALIGVATLLVAASYTMASFGTACIEAMFASTLMLLALERVDAGRPLTGGVAGIAATMTHPDHGLLYAALAAALLLDPKRRVQLIRYLLPFALLFIPYFLWRWSYYGDLMPNTFYTKSASKLYFEQGIKYVLVTVIGNGLWATLPLLAIGAYYARRSLIGRYLLIGLPLYLTYVAKVGGDFMLGRFFVAALPMWFLLVQAGYSALVAKGRAKSATAALVLAGVAALPTAVIKPGEVYHGIADERTFAPVKDFATMEVDAFGYTLGRDIYRDLTVRGTTPKIAVWCIGMFGYYVKLPVFDLRGLTSRSVAHLPILERGRPGHEKDASPSLVVQSGTQLSELPVFPPPYSNVSRTSVASGIFLHLVRYDTELVQRLGRSARVVDYPSHLDQQIPSLAQRTPHELACDLWHMREYYFASNPDPVRRARVLSEVARADPSLAGAERLFFESPDLEQRGWRKVRAFTFEPGELAWRAEGDAAGWPALALRPTQPVPMGQSGSFINSFLPPNGDVAMGQLTSPEFVLEGDVVTLRIGGVMAPETERVTLLVEGQAVRTATGCGSEWLGLRVWNVATLRGKRARYLIEDRDPGGHIVADEIAEWKAP